MIPAHRSGAASVAEKPSGSRNTPSARAVILSAYPPSRSRPVKVAFSQRFSRLERQKRHTPQVEAIQPTPTLSPTAIPSTPGPTSETRPAAWCPGIRGRRAATSPSRMCRSVRQTPHASMSIANSPAAGTGSGARAATSGISSAAATRSSVMALIAPILSPRGRGGRTYNRGGTRTDGHETSGCASGRLRFLPPHPGQPDLPRLRDHADRLRDRRDAPDRPSAGRHPPDTRGSGDRRGIPLLRDARSPARRRAARGARSPGPRRARDRELVRGSRRVRARLGFPGSRPRRLRKELPGVLEEPDAPDGRAVLPDERALPNPACDVWSKELVKGLPPLPAGEGW